MAKDMTAGAQQQAGAGGPVKSGSAVTGGGVGSVPAGKGASVIGAHTAASKPGEASGKVAGHIGAKSGS